MSRESIYPNKKFCSNNSTTIPTFPIIQCRHGCRIQYHSLSINHHAAGATSDGIDADQPIRMRRKHQQPQHPYYYHYPGINLNQTSATKQSLTGFCRNILLDTRKVCTIKRSLQQSVKPSGYIKPL